VESGDQTFQEHFTKASSSLLLLTWSFLTLFALGIGDLVLLLLGNTWAEAASVAPLLIAIGAFQIPVSIFSGVVEVRNKFEKAYVAEVILLGIQVASIIALIGQITDLTTSVCIMGSITLLRLFWYAGILISDKVLEFRSFFASVFMAGCTAAILYYLHLSLESAIRSSNSGIEHAPLLVSSLLGLILILMISSTSHGRRKFREFAWLIQDN
jgi:O-antigen/teichoic acid export membrane protein